jgi:NAD(P)H-dependent FMN reductase
MTGRSAASAQESVMHKYKVGYLIGSLAKGSINRLLSRALIELAPDELEFTEITFGDLPLYSYDYDEDFPDVAKAFKRALAEVDAVLFVTPEYNRSIPGGLKNAIDWASRPYGKNSFARKPAASNAAIPLGNDCSMRCTACSSSNSLFMPESYPERY